ncbi:hypothetical protein BH23CHL7_BH23CHL7_12360 [soil metagenome]
MLRNPIDVMHAQHAQLLFNRREDITDFERALAAEPARRRGERVPVDALRPEALFYRHSVRFAEQVARYLEVFGRERIHFVIFDDLVADAQTAYRGVLEFLEVDPNVPIEPIARNQNRESSSGLIGRAVFAPPARLRPLYARLRRSAVAHRLRDVLLRLGSRRVSRRPMAPALRQRLAAEPEPEVLALGELIGRDLSAWSESPAVTVRR